MKRFTMLAFAVMMAMSTMCFAAGDGSALNKMQKVSETFLSVFTDNPANIAAIHKGVVPELKEKLTPKLFDDLRSNLVKQAGKYKGFRFVQFIREEKSDKVVYLLDFAKGSVPYVFVFNTDGMLLGAGIPQTAPAEQQKVSNKK